jgi:hypothetical protein
MTTKPQPDFLRWRAVAEPSECKEVRRLLGYLWTATGFRSDNLCVRDLFADDDSIVADVERLAIFPKETK